MRHNLFWLSDEQWARILSAVGYNLRLILAWLRDLLRLVLAALVNVLHSPSAVSAAC